MAPAERLQRQFAFLIECDRLKDILRQTHNAYGGRQENDAEHSWALCLAHSIDRCQAMLLSLSKGQTWNRHNVTVDQVRARNAPIGDGASAVWTYMSGCWTQSYKAGHLTT